MKQDNFGDCKIALVDGDLADLEKMDIYLKKGGFEVKKFQLAEKLLDYLGSELPNLIMVALNLPDAYGLDLCKFLKTDDHLAHIPVILLTKWCESVNEEIGLEIGVDECLVKNFCTRVIILRLRNILRKENLTIEKRRMKHKINVIGNNLAVDSSRFQVFLDGKRLDLSLTEFNVLQMLSEKKGWVFTRSQIIANLGRDKDISERTIDVHIKSLRTKLGKLGKCIKTVRGVGYKIEYIKAQNINDFRQK